MLRLPRRRVCLTASTESRQPRSDGSILKEVANFAAGRKASARASTSTRRRTIALSAVSNRKMFLDFLSVWETRSSPVSPLPMIRSLAHAAASRWGSRLSLLATARTRSLYTSIAIAPRTLLSDYMVVIFQHEPSLVLSLFARCVCVRLSLLRISSSQNSCA